MLLCASDSDHKTVEVLRVPEGSTPGERITGDMYTNDPGNLTLLRKVMVTFSSSAKLLSRVINEAVLTDLLSQTNS